MRVLKPCIDCGCEQTSKNRGAKGRCDRCYQRWRRATLPDVYQARDKARWPQRREAQNQRRKEYYEAHKEEHLRKMKIYHIEHAEQIRAQQKEYYERVKDWRLARDKEYKKRRRAHFRPLAAARSKRWLEKRPREEVLEMWRRYSQVRMARKAALPATLTNEEWHAILDGFDHRCVYCGRQFERLTQDHIIPIVNGGPYTADNIVPACLSCNSRKSYRSATDFILELTNGSS